MKKVLIIQFRKDKAKIRSEQKAFSKILKNYNFNFASVFNKNNRVFEDPDFALKNYSHIILGGSSEFGLAKETIHPVEKKEILRRTEKLIKTAIKRDQKLMGICFGHHLIAFLLGAKIQRPKKQRELGKIKVQLNPLGKKDPLFRGFRKNFPALTAHIESVVASTQMMDILASTDKCSIAAFRIKNNIYGLQFHPELNEKLFSERLRLGNNDGDDYVNISKTGKTDTKKLITNFIEL